MMFAFVLMPFDASFEDIYKLGIKEVAETLGIKAERVDEQIFHKENILERIYSQIAAADFVIADMTGRNPNVFYEVGYAHAKGKTCLLLTSRADDIPFDLKHHRHVVYGDSITSLRQTMRQNLESLKAEALNARSIISIELTRIDGLLDKTFGMATGNLDLFLDLHNRTNGPSPELEALYIYSGSGWSFSQDGVDAPSTNSDIDGYQVRHFIRPPLRRLQTGAWAQIKISGKKILAFESSNDKLKDKYRVSGRSLIKAITSNGTFDFLIKIEKEVEEFPF